MGRAYSIDLRERVVAAVETGGLSCHRAAAQFGVGVSTAIRWVQRVRKTGSVAPGQIFLAALRHNRIEAPWLLEGPIDGESFRTYVENVLGPTLREGDIVIMDNLGSHKGKQI